MCKYPGEQLIYRYEIISNVYLHFLPAVITYPFP